jgi:hypothetical protein
MNTYEYALQKSQCIELDHDDPSTSSSTKRLEEKIENLQQTIKNLSIRRDELWCTSCCEEGHTEETFNLSNQPPPTTNAHRIQAQKYCNICECLTDHNVQYCPHNLKKTKWYHICEASNHKTSECHFNARNKSSVRTLYYIEATNQANNYTRRDDYYCRGRGQGGRG